MQPRIGIIGCGGIAAHHANACRANGATVTALADLHRPAAEKMASGLPRNPRVFDTADELIESGLADVVCICTPPADHEHIAVAALARGIHVICEKPLAHTLESGRRVLEAAERSSALLMPGFRHRFLPAIRRIRELVVAGAIGEIVYLNNVFAGPASFLKDRWFGKRAIAGGGALMDTTSHSVDLFRFLCGEIGGQRGFTHTSLPGIDVEDTGILIVKSEQGAVGAFTASWIAGTGSAVIDIMGTKGRIFFDYDRDTEIRVLPAEGGEPQIIAVKSSLGFVEEMAHFFRAIRGEEPLGCTARDGLRALEIIQNVYTA